MNYYIIKEKGRREYVATARLRVMDPDFARRFKNARQAKLFMSTCNMNARDFEIEEVEDHT